MPSNKLTRLARIEAQVVSVRDSVFFAYLDLLPTEDAIALLGLDESSQVAQTTRLESWLIGAQPQPAHRSDLWKQAISQVIDPDGLNDWQAIRELVAEWRELDKWRR
jgi:hypothetical protein